MKEYYHISGEEVHKITEVSGIWYFTKIHYFTKIPKTTIASNLEDWENAKKQLITYINNLK